MDSLTSLIDEAVVVVFGRRILAPNIKVEELVEGEGRGVPFLVSLGICKLIEESIERRFLKPPAGGFLDETMSISDLKDWHGGAYRLPVAAYVCDNTPYR